MYKYSYTKVVNTDKLETEIKASNLPYSYLETMAPNHLCVWMSQELSWEQEGQLTSLVSSHSPSIQISAAEQLKDKILNAMTFGRGLIAEYGVSNIMSGYSIEEIQIIMDKTAKVQAALNTGSLYVALVELEAIEVDGHIITEEKITEFRHKIQDYLNIPRT